VSLSLATNRHRGAKCGASASGCFAGASEAAPSGDEIAKAIAPSERGHGHRVPRLSDAPIPTPTPNPNPKI